MIPAVVVLKDRPLERGHRLHATWTPTGKQRTPRPKDPADIWCSCGRRMCTTSVAHYQRGLDLVARDYRRSGLAHHYPNCVDVERVA